VQKMTITASSKLPEADVRKMVDEAKEFEEQDRQRKEEVEAKNIADSLVYTAEKTKTDLADKLNPDMVERLNAAITAVKAALEGKDTSSIKTETEKLQKMLSEAGAAAYQAAARQQGASQNPGQPSQDAGGSGSAGGPGGENVVDADFKVKDDK